MLDFELQLAGGRAAGLSFPAEGPSIRRLA